MGARGEVVSVVAERYRADGRIERGGFFDELCAVRDGIASTHFERSRQARDRYRGSRGSGVAFTAHRFRHVGRNTDDGVQGMTRELVDQESHPSQTACRPGPLL